MDIEITKNLDNPLFGRHDIEFVLRHSGGATPKRAEVRQLVAAEVGTKTENVVIDKMSSATGMARTRGIARAYQNADAARAVERKHHLKRNNLFQEKKADGGSE